jgi:hypothetical protein
MLGLFSAKMVCCLHSMIRMGFGEPEEPGGLYQAGTPIAPNQIRNMLFAGTETGPC